MAKAMGTTVIEAVKFRRGRRQEEYSSCLCVLDIRPR
jgi:hypothetical protein